MNEYAPKKAPVIPFATKAQREAGDLKKEAIDSILRKEAARKLFWDKLNGDV